MRGKKLVKLMVLLFMAALLALLPSLTQIQVSAETLTELQDRQDELEAQKKENDAKLDELKNNIDAKEEYAAALKEQQDTLAAQIDTMNAEITAIDAQISEMEEKISGTQASIDENMEKLKQRLRALYVAGEATTLEIILNSENLVDFAEKTELMKAVTQHDTQLMQGLREQITSISEEKKQIEAHKEQITANKKELDDRRTELSELVEETQKVLSELNSEKGELDEKSDQLEADLSEADAAVDKWYEEYYANQNQSSGGSSGGSGSGSSGGYTGTGTFTWPCPGFTYLSSYWGDGRDHKGIDIAGYNIYGQPVVAADDGKVIYAVYSGWGGGYGLCVYLDHGNGYSTRYAHCSGVAVNIGDTVKKGQVIAYVGSTGDSSGPHLHFEIRYNGVAQDPMQWFS